MKKTAMVLFASACLFIFPSPKLIAAAATTTLGTIPAGRQISVLTNETINAGSTAVGRTYSAEVENNITDANGKLLIPKGSPAQLVVLDVVRGGKSELQLGLRSITVNGVVHPVETAVITKTGTSGTSASRTIGGGALLGTAVGAFAGGSRKGAAIGAVSGAGAGTAVHVLTRGREVKVPAETVLTYRLQEPIRVRG